MVRKSILVTIVLELHLGCLAFHQEYNLNVKGEARKEKGTTFPSAG